MYKQRKVLLSAVVAMLLTGCGGSGGSSGGGDDDGLVVDTQSPVGETIPEANQRIIANEESRAYRADGDYADVLPRCALASTDEYCTLEELPYIGQVNPEPSISDVMNRVVVTHDWMGVRFEQMLRRMPADMVLLFAPVTSILIGSNVRPSGFNSSRGAIRLDPDFLWLSVDEKRTISIADDFRSNFGADLQFVSYWRYVYENNWAIGYSSLEDDNEREVWQLDISLARLLYHELAHANDYVQTDKLASLPLSATPGDARELLRSSRVSNLLYEDASLTEQTAYLYGLAGVRYFDRAPTEFQRTVLADFAGSEMAAGGKTTFYSYSTIREDVANLMEAAMMKYHYDVDIDVVYANKVEDRQSCDDVKISWGVRNRLANNIVAPRARFVVRQILGRQTGLENFFDGNMGDTTPLREGAGWCESVNLGNTRTVRSVNSDAVGREWEMQMDLDSGLLHGAAD